METDASFLCVVYILFNEAKRKNSPEGLLFVAEKKIQEEKRKAEDTLKDVSKYYQRIINEMKLKSTQKGALFLRQHRFSFGEQTPFHSEGIVLFKGDEVAKGRKGGEGFIVQI